jgi:hypothetical protein
MPTFLKLKIKGGIHGFFSYFRGEVKTLRREYDDYSYQSGRGGMKQGKHNAYPALYDNSAIELSAYFKNHSCSCITCSATSPKTIASTQHDHLF